MQCNGLTSKVRFASIVLCGASSHLGHLEGKEKKGKGVNFKRTLQKGILIRNSTKMTTSALDVL